MIKVIVNSVEDCNLIFENCKKIWEQDGTIGSSINFLIDYYGTSEDFPVSLKYDETINKLSFEDASESCDKKYSIEYDVENFIKELI